MCPSFLQKISRLKSVTYQYTKNLCKILFFYEKIFKKIFPVLKNTGKNISYSSTITGSWPVCFKKMSSTSAVFSFTEEVLRQGWQPKYSASTT